MASMTAAPHRVGVPSWARPQVLLIVMGALASVVMACSMSGQLTPIGEPLLRLAGASASTPQITVSQTTGTTVCSSTSSTCSDADLYGGGAPLAPGQSHTVVMRLSNTGPVDVATRTLVTGNCVATTIPGAVGSTTPTPNHDLCRTVRVAIFEGTPGTGKRLYAGKAATIPTRLTLAPLTPDATQTYTFRVSLPATASSATQGQTITQTLTWTNTL